MTWLEQRCPVNN